MLLGYDLSSHELVAQTRPVKHYDRAEFSQLRDSLSQLTGATIICEDDSLWLATALALVHYPELYGNHFQIRYKKNVRHPITASWSFWNIFKRRDNHLFILLIAEDAFLLNLDLNKQVGVIGHEMAHFAYYKDRPSINMLPWGINYVTSKKFRIGFEKDADMAAIKHGLGWQLLEIAFYTPRDEIIAAMKAQGYIL